MQSKCFLPFSDPYINSYTRSRQSKSSYFLANVYIVQPPFWQDIWKFKVLILKNSFLFEDLQFVNFSNFLLARISLLDFLHRKLKTSKISKCKSDLSSERIWKLQQTLQILKLQERAHNTSSVKYGSSITVQYVQKSPKSLAR